MRLNSKVWSQLYVKASIPLISVEMCNLLALKSIESNPLVEFSIHEYLQQQPLHVFTRQDYVQRNKLKKSKGSDDSISMFHSYILNMEVSDDLLHLLVRLLAKIREGDTCEKDKR